jgi:hypothetical protein
MKFFITAPFMTVGSRPARCRIQPIIPVVVDLPLVPPMAMLRGAALKSAASSSARVVIFAPSRRAACTSGTLSSTAAAAVLRVKPDAAGAQKFELLCGSALV